MPDPTKFLSNDRALRDGFTLHPIDEEILAVTKATAERPLPEDLARVMEGGGFIPPPAAQEISFGMGLALEIWTAFMKQYLRRSEIEVTTIRRQRLSERCSWRWIAQEFAKRHGGNQPWQPEWNQLGGMALCIAASEIAGENALKAPWN